MKVRVSIIESSNATGKERADSLLNDINEYKRELSEKTEKSFAKKQRVVFFKNRCIPYNSDIN